MTIEMNGSTYCNRCFSPVPQGAQCVCKNTANDPSLLANGAILSGRYIVGNGFRETDVVTEYIGFDSKMNCRVVIKEFFPRLLSRRNADGSLSVIDADKRTAYKQLMQAFVQRLQKISSLAQESAAVRIRDAFYANETSYFIVEEIRGISAAEYGAHGAVMERAAALHTLRSLLLGIYMLHANGIVHGNLCPDTVYLVGKAVVIDGFEPSTGVVSAVLRDSVPAKINTGFLPISAYGSSKNKPSVDIFSAGAILYFLLTGKKPSSMFSEEKRLDAQALSQSRAGEELTKLILNMCGQGAYAYESAEAAIRDLNPILRASNLEEIPLPNEEKAAPLSPVASPSVPESPVAAPKKNKRSNILIVAAAAALILIVLGVVLGLKLAHKPAKPDESVTQTDSSVTEVSATEAQTTAPAETRTQTKVTHEAPTEPTAQGTTAVSTSSGQIVVPTTQESPETTTAADDDTSTTQSKTSPVLPPPPTTSKPQIVTP